MGLHAKLYSLDVPNKQSHIKVKGVKKHYVKKNVRHDEFLAVLRQNKTHTKATFRSFRSTNHVLQTVEMTKLCLSAFDDKRYILARWHMDITDFVKSIRFVNDFVVGTCN